MIFILSCDDQSNVRSLFLSRSNAITNAIKNNSSSVVGINVITMDQKRSNYNKFWNSLIKVYKKYEIENFMDKKIIKLFYIVNNINELKKII